jgi:NADH-quinone oxidoreductase subunit N
MLLVPELVLLVTMCVLFLAGPMLVSDAGEAPRGLRNQWGFLSVMTIAIAWYIWFNGSRDVEQGALFQLDHLVWYTRGISLSFGLILALLLWHQIDDGHAAEAHACLLAILAGTNLVAASDDLVSLFLALELVSIPTYVLLYLPRRDRPGREATVKYFLLSAFSSALVLYGMSWLYGLSGSTNLDAIAAAIGGTADAGPARQSVNTMARVALAFIIAGLSFRITAVPFHFYAPDVFQGTTNSNAALLSFIPKVVGFVALLRLLPLMVVAPAGAGWTPEPSLGLLLACMAVATMFVGNVMAWRQTNLYRLMAYSSIAHAGYMLIGLTVGDAGPVPGTDATLFYLAGYGFMTLGVFALLAGVRSTELGARSASKGESNVRTTDQSLSDSPLLAPCSLLSDLRGLNRTNPTTAILLAVCLLSLTGLPPTIGFLGKLNLFFAAWGDSAAPASAATLGRTLAVLLALNAAIGAWYYLRIIALMFLDSPAETSSHPAAPAWSSFLAGVLCTAGTVLFFVQPQWLWDVLP